MGVILNKIRDNSLNLFSLIAIQVSNAVLPLLVFPFVLGKIGDKNYSDVAVTEAIMFIIYAFVLYSFEVNGVSKAVYLIEEKRETALSHLFTKVLLVRLLIFSLGMIFVLGSFFVVNNTFFLLLLAWMLYPLSFILQSSFFYLALEKNFDLAIIVVLSRIMCLGLIYFFIDETSSGILVPVIIGVTYCLAGVSSTLILIFKYRIKIVRVSWLEIRKSLLEGKQIFFGNISVLLFRDINVLLLGIFTQNTLAISSYSIAEKIIKSIQASIRPLNQFYFPKGVKLLRGYYIPSLETFFIIAKVTKIQLLILVIMAMSLILFFYSFSEKIPFINNYPNVELIFTFCLIMLGSIFFGVMNFMFGTLGLNHLNGEKYFTISIFSTGLISLLFSLILINLIGGYGAAINFVIAEIMLFGFVFRKYFLSKKKNFG